MKNEPKIFNRNCFAFFENNCNALTKIDCAKCAFFKTAEQLAEERAKCEKRLSEIAAPQKDSRPKQIQKSIKYGLDVIVVKGALKR